ncbi:MAG: acyl-CoA desaturase [Deltaproteobacteria bacterium]|nr:acyl-CoA desaturase [Deltaproteobacteria bacterium]
MSKRARETWSETYLNRGTAPFWGFHLVAILGVLYLGFSWTGLGLALAFYVARMFFITAGFHRYFSHRAFKTSRPVQAVLAFGAQTSLQRGALFWAAKHRHHHRFSDTPDDVHSAVRDGFWWSHLGWSTSKTSNGTDLTKVADLAKFPELVWLNRWKHLPAVMLAVALLALGGVHALVWGFFVSTVLLWHGTFTINSLSHMFGRRRYETTDTSRNNWALAILTMGEGWHNNHHHYQSSANQGFRWWQIDVTYYLLRGLAAVGLIWDVRRAPPHVVHGHARAPAAAAVPAALAAG